MKLENEHFAITVGEDTGAISSLYIKRLAQDLIGEDRLQANFRICLPVEGYESNYIEGMQQAACVHKEGNSIIVKFSTLKSPQGEYPIDLEYTIELCEDTIRFRSKLHNPTSSPISEFWFPQIGGWTDYGKSRDARAAVPEYLDCQPRFPFFKQFPGSQRLGAESAEWNGDYPGLFLMPWIDFYDGESNTGLYLGYHDPIFRKSTWHAGLFPRESGNSSGWISPSDAAGLPVGMVFSHVRYPFIKNHETFESGEFVLHAHAGDWHTGAQFYGKWFRERFPLRETPSWLRKKSTWFSSIIYQPEDRIVTDYEGYAKWCEEAEEFAIDTFELIGWDKGGLERDYPEYIPEEKLGGRKGLQKLLGSINERGSKCLLFVNYNILDPNTEWYRKELHAYTRQDRFGTTPNWMCWGEGTLLARNGYARRHLLSSIVPPFEQILEAQFLELVKDGAHAFQIDKLCVASDLDFNPLNTWRPDEALHENMIRSIARLLHKCREIDPDFCLAAEAATDRLIPYIEVFYRNASGSSISPLRYVFPEWTSCAHISAPFDYNGVNGAVLTGAVICVEPLTYQGSLALPLYRKLALYIKEIERLRQELADIIFLGRYHDTVGGRVERVTAAQQEAEILTKRAIGAEVMIPGGASTVSSAPDGNLLYKVHERMVDGLRAIVVVNNGVQPIDYKWEFLHKEVKAATLYQPFTPARKVSAEEAIKIDGARVQILVEA